MNKIIIYFLLFAFSATLSAQPRDINYYLPAISYDARITSPEQFLGFQIGEWHVSHDQVVAYMRLLATQSDRIQLNEYARSHEKRPLLLLTFSDPTNLRQIEKIRTQHLALSNQPESEYDLSTMPLVIYQGYSIHGNESSGVNAAMLVAFYLAAGQSAEIDVLLKNTIILLDPCFNPDGVQRFSTWANSHKGKTLISDPKSREFNEIWPGGRTNHYWFDLNRDWLYLTHPESEGRVRTFQKWRPNILTDHHEMGSNSTFFFQPGVQSRVNPNTPTMNQELTKEIGNYHAAILDSIGSHYFTQRNYDDFYYGKGSTYPDILGGVGILFEQASSRGHLQETSNGLLSFPFTIRNQVATSISTQRAALSMRIKLLKYQKDFYLNQRKLVKQSSVRGYVINDSDHSKMERVIHILYQHDIMVKPLTRNVTLNGKVFSAASSYFIPLDQRQSALIISSFEKVKNFKDSIFYDVSAWTMPLAFGLNYSEIVNVSHLAIGDFLPEPPLAKGKFIAGKISSAFILEWDQFGAAAALYELQNKQWITKVVHGEMKLYCDGSIHDFHAGDIVIQAQGSESPQVELQAELIKLADTHKVNIYGIDSGLGLGDFSIGSPDVRSLEKPQVFTIIGQGVNSYDAGELWHYMDYHLHLPMTMIDKKDLASASINRYNTLVIVEGNYSDLPETTFKKIEEWAKNGGRIIAFENAASWLVSKSLIKQKEIEFKSKDTFGTYESAFNSESAKEVPGSIFEAHIDQSHPLAYGYKDRVIYTFKEDTRLVKPTENRYASPLLYSSTPLAAGYLPKGFEQLSKGSAALTLHSIGKGSAIAFANNPLFRGFWLGNYKLMDNAIFFGSTINRLTLEGQ